MTPAESTRFRQISYERQLTRGFASPGYAGLIAEYFADAVPYKPAMAEPSESAESAEREGNVHKQVSASSLLGVDESLMASHVSSSFRR
jgi:hypothetical protein